MMIDILLSTYNSEKYIKALLDSLVAQSYKDWKLLVRDDGSNDQTISILNDFKKNNSKQISILNGHKCLGPKKSFEHLLKNSSANYSMFCDHDDVWLPHKIEESLALIQQLEQKNHNKAALVFTDLTVVDEDLNTIHPSFWKYSKLDPRNIFNSYKLLINNPAPGCTFIINKKVKELVLPFPEQATMHDWWIALKVSESGVVNYSEKASLLYRQHNSNKIGAEHVKGNYLTKRIANFSSTWNENKRTYQMMKCLSKDYSLLKLLYYKLSISFSKLI